MTSFGHSVCIALVSGMLALSRSAHSTLEQRQPPTPPQDTAPEEERLAPEQSSLTVEPVLVVRDVVPDLAGAKVLSLGRMLPLKGGLVAVVARVGSVEGDLVLIGVRNAKAEVLAVDTRATKHEGSSSARRLAIRLSSTMWREGSNVLQGGERLYIGDPLPPFSKFDKLGSSGTDYSVWSWGAAGLTRVLGPGDTISFNGKTWALGGAGLVDANMAGTVLLSFATTSPVKALGLALCDERGIRPLVIKGESLPGRPSTRLQDSTMKFPVNFGEAILAEDGGVLFRFYAEEGGKKRLGLWYVTEEASRPILQEKEPFVGAAGAVALTMTPLAAQSADRFLAEVAIKEGISTSHNVYICSDGSCHELTGDYLLSGGAVRGAWYLSPTSPALFFQLEFTSATSSPLWTSTGQVEGMGLFDGQRVQGLLEPGEMFVPLLVQAAELNSDLSGLIIAGAKSAESESPTIGAFLDARQPEKGLQPVPLFLARGDLVVHLHQFVAWEAPGQALVWLPAGERGSVDGRAGLYRIRGLEDRPTPASSALAPRSSSER